MHVYAYQTMRTSIQSHGEDSVNAPLTIYVTAKCMNNIETDYLCRRRFYVIRAVG